jgi:MFS family permease
VTLVIAWMFMRDIGFTPERGVTTRTAVRNVVRGALDNGIRNPPVRWLMLASPFVGGVGFYAFYAFQPYLLELFGDPDAYSIAGLAAAIVAGAQIVGGLIVPWVRRLFARRTDALIVGGIINVGLLALVGWVPNFWLAIVLLSTWAMVFAFEMPLRQAFINGVIPSEQRATVISFDSFMGSAGGVVIQPALGRAADVFGYPASYVLSAAVQAVAVPFAFLARRENAPSDPMRDDADEAEPEAAPEPMP